MRDLVLHTLIVDVDKYEDVICPACQLSRHHRKTPTSHRTTVDRNQQMELERDHIKPGDKISMDQYSTSTPGRLLHNRDGSRSLKYVGGTLFVDHASGYIHIHNQVSMRAGNTLVGKRNFEAIARDCGVKLKSFHADNHPFGAAEFMEDIELQGQTVTFSGVGAHHQNGAAE